MAFESKAADAFCLWKRAKARQTAAKGGRVKSESLQCKLKRRLKARWPVVMNEMLFVWLRTNLLVKGWVSTDRSEVAALLITTPRPRTKSSTNDLTPPRRMGWISNRPPSALIGRTAKTFDCGWLREQVSYRCLPTQKLRKLSSHIRAGFWLRGVQP